MILMEGGAVFSVRYLTKAYGAPGFRRGFMPYGQGGGNCILVQKNIGIIQAGLNSEPQRGGSWFSPVFYYHREGAYGQSDYQGKHGIHSRGNYGYSPCFRQSGRRHKQNSGNS